jgi:hypothetical protein
MVKDADGKPLSMAEEFDYTGQLQFIGDFGVWRLTVKDAAELVALDMWYSGEIQDIEEPEDWDGSEHDPRLRALLMGHAEAFEARLLAAVDCGRLEAALVRRGFDEQLIPDETHISYSDLDEWLRERGYERGDIMAEWETTEAEIAAQVCDEVAYLRAASKSGGVIRRIALQGMLAKAGKLDEPEVGDLVAAYKAMVTENERLKEQLAHAKTGQPAKVDRPLPTRQRRTLLTIIAAFCKYERLDPKARGTAQRIMEMTDGLGAHVDDGTIATVLSEIPDALETRMK